MTKAAKEASEPGGPAAEVCSSMIRADVANQLTRGALQGTPKLSKVGADTVCNYTMVGGSLRMSVHTSPTTGAARAYFAKQRRTARRTITVDNLGTDAFTASDGSTFTLKDDKVLTVDVTRLPRGNDGKQIAQSLSFEVLSCWTG